MSDPQYKRIRANLPMCVVVGGWVIVVYVLNVLCVGVGVCEGARTCMRERMYTHKHIHACVHVYVHVCVYVCMY